jgi:hypothetical protein
MRQRPERRPRPVQRAPQNRLLRRHAPEGELIAELRFDLKEMPVADRFFGFARHSPATQEFNRRDVRRYAARCIRDWA